MMLFDMRFNANVNYRLEFIVAISIISIIAIIAILDLLIEVAA